jgi:ABC-type lipoprotein release transport system permease subunit
MPMKTINQFKLIFEIFNQRDSTKKFALAVSIGIGFSMAIILSTIGIMDGFEKALLSGLKKATGEISLYSNTGFFVDDARLKEVFDQFKINKASTVVQTESFLIFNDDSKGVLVKGVDQNFSFIVGLKLSHLDESIAIGSALAESLKIQIGDEVVLTFPKGNSDMKGLPALIRFKVGEIVTHGIFQKDSRLVYMSIGQLQKILDLKDKINSITFNLPKVSTEKNERAREEEFIKEMRISLPSEFYLRPYWKEFSTLIEAVRVEKKMISIILQIVVVVAIFNMLAFIIFVNERKSKELFLFKALGMSQKKLSSMWLKLVFVAWLLACLFAFIFVQIFKLLLEYLPLFKLPADIYFMPRLTMALIWQDYGLVFISSLLWINIITFIILKKMQKSSLLEGLRQEFA